MKFYPCHKRKIAVKPTIHRDSAVSKALLGKSLNRWSYVWILSPENYCIPPRHRLLGQTTKQTLSKFEPQKPWKYKEPWELRPDPSCLEKNKRCLEKKK